MKSKLKTNLVEKETYIDKETGEILEQNIKKHKYLVKDKESFMLVYTKLLSVFQETEMSLPEIRVFSYLLQTWNFNVQYEVGMTTYSLLGSKFSIKPESVRNAFYKLKERNLIFSTKSKLYMLNPRYAFKGSSLERNNSLKSIIELGCENC